MPVKVIMMVLLVVFYAGSAFAGRPPEPKESTTVYALCGFRFTDSVGARDVRCFDVSAQLRACEAAGSSCASWEKRRIMYLAKRIDKKIMVDAASLLVGENDPEDSAMQPGGERAASVRPDPSAVRLLLAGDQSAPRYRLLEWLDGSDRAAAEIVKSRFDKVDPRWVRDLVGRDDFACWLLDAPDREQLLQSGLFRHRASLKLREQLDSADSWHQQCAVLTINLVWSELNADERLQIYQWLSMSLGGSLESAEHNAELERLSGAMGVMFRDALRWQGVDGERYIVDHVVMLATKYKLHDWSEWRLRRAPFSLGVWAGSVPKLSDEPESMVFRSGVSGHELARRFFTGGDWPDFVGRLRRDEVLLLLEALEDGDPSWFEVPDAVERLLLLRGNPNYAGSSVIRLRVLRLVDAFDQHDEGLADSLKPYALDVYRNLAPRQQAVFVGFYPALVAPEEGVTVLAKMFDPDLAGLDLAAAWNVLVACAGVDRQVTFGAAWDAHRLLSENRDYLDDCWHSKSIPSRLLGNEKPSAPLKIQVHDVRSVDGEADSL